MRFWSKCVVFLCVIAVGVSAEEWRSETIDGSMKNGLYNAMTRDAQGYPHIVTYDSEEQTIEYLYENAAGWHVEVIEAVNVYGTFPSIALDSGGYPHVTYCDGDNDSIRYARKNQNGWVRQTVAAPVTVVDNTLIALNSSGTPYVFYDDGNPAIIKCASWNGSQWVIENVASGFGPWGRYARFSAVIDDMDTIHLSFVRYGATDLIYTYRDGSGWHEEVVDNNWIRGDYTSIVIDGLGRPHIAYTTDTESNDRYAVNLKYAVKNGGNWQLTTVDNDGDVGDFVTLALTGNGLPVMSYYDLQNETMKFAGYNGTAWQKESVDPDTAVGMFACMVLKDNSRACIAYHDDSNDDLKVAVQTESGWAIERPVTTGKKGLYKWIAVDGKNYPHIAYSGGGSEDLKYAWIDETGWNIEIADTTGKCGFRVALALDSGGYPHIIHGDTEASVIKYSYKDASGWHSETVTDYLSSRSEWSLCLGPDNQPHVCHIDPDTDYLLYTTRNGQGWQTETVLMEDMYRATIILMMESGGTPCITLTFNSYIKFARRTGGNWTVENVSPHSTLNGDISAALDGNDHPHIVYHDSDAIQYIHHNGTEWRTEIVDNIGSFIWGGLTAIALDASGSPHIIFDDVDSARIAYYSKDGDDWVDEKCINDGNISHGCFIIDGNNIPHICYYDGYLSYTVNVPDITEVRIVMPATHFNNGSTFACDAVVSNDQMQPLSDYPLFVILEAYGMYFFAPSFNSEFDCYLTLYPVFHTGRTIVPVLPEFTWPAAGSGGATWYAALTDPSMTALYGEMDIAGFTWSEQ